MSHEQIARGIGPAHLDIAYERHGDPAHPPVLLIMGLGAQLIHWAPGFVAELVARRLHVVRFDNRDAGRSTHLQKAPSADLPAVLRGDLSSVTYTLSDMTGDALGLLDALGIESAHVVGASLGGAIAQTLAIRARHRVRSLASLMSTTGAPDVGQPHPATLASLFSGPTVVGREAVIARALRASAIVGSPAYPSDPSDVADLAGRAFDRGHDDAAMARQAVASVASGDRTAQLRELSIPTLVLHGLSDTLCDPSGGRATAAAIAGAELVLIEGMGHNLPPALWPRIADHIAQTVQRGEAVLRESGGTR